MKNHLVLEVELSLGDVWCSGTSRDQIQIAWWIRYWPQKVSCCYKSCNTKGKHSCSMAKRFLFLMLFLFLFSESICWVILQLCICVDWLFWFHFFNSLPIFQKIELNASPCLAKLKWCHSLDVFLAFLDQLIYILYHLWWRNCSFINTVHD